MATPANPVATSEAPKTVHESNKPARWASPARIATAVFLVALIVWAYWPTLLELVHIWDSSPDYSHGYLVLPLAAWFLWRRRDKLPWGRIAPSWWGLSLIALAAVLRVVAGRFYLPELDGCSLPLWLGGACWLFGGGALARWASPALAFLLFMVPLPASVETLLNQPLQSLATTMSTWTLQSLGQPAIAEGTTILLGENILEVERACSGLRMFYGILALAFAYIIVSRARRTTALVLLAAVAPVAILANVIRITATGLLYEYASGDAARRFSHDLAGLAMIVLAVALFGLVLVATDRTVTQFRRTRSRALLRTVVVLLVIAAIVPAGYFWHESLQKSTVEKFLRRADQLTESGEYAKAIEYMDRYLRVQPDAVEVYERLARTADRVAFNPLRKLRVMEMYGQAWDRAPDRIELGMRQGQIAIDLARFDEALSVSSRLARTVSAEGEITARAQAAGARLKALALLGRSNAPDVVMPEAEWKNVVTAFQEAIQKNPHDIDLAARLADIDRHRLKHPSEAERIKLADKAIDSMVAMNAERPEAWLSRYLYRKSLKAAGENVGGDADADLDKALDMGRKDPKKESADVLLYAGQRAADKKDVATARSYFERATQVRPADFRGWLRLGELTAGEGTDAARSQAVDIWNKGLDAVGQYEIDLIMPLTATLIQLRRFADAEEKLRPLDGAIQRLMEPGRSLVELGAARLRAGSSAAKGNTMAAAMTLRNVLNDTREGTASTVYRTPFADAWVQLGDYYTELRFDDQAAEAYETAGRLDRNVPEWRMKAARATERNGRPGEAVQHYRAVVERDPQNPAMWLALARACFLDQVAAAPAERNWQEFQTAFKKAAETKANVVVLYLLEADYASAQGRPDESAKILTKAASRVPKAWELWQALALTEQRLKADAEVQKAVASFEKCAPSPESIPLFKSRLAIEAGRLDDARSMLEASLSTLSDTAKTSVAQQLVELDLRQGKRGDARRRLEEAAAREPDNLQTLDTLAQLLADERDWKGLEDVEHRLKKVEGEDGTLWREYRARRLLFESAELDDPRFREADRLAREIGSLRPTWQRRYVLQGVLARRQNQFDEAIADYQQAIRLGNRSIGLSEELIDLLIEQRRFTEADREFQRVRQAVARSSRLSSVAIPIFVRRGESDEALRLAEDWVRRQPTDAASHVRLGRTLLLTTPESSAEYQKVLGRAQLEYEHAVELAPTDVRMWVELFRFYTGVQKNDEAADAMLGRLAKRIDIPQPQKVFVLAQLYESIGNRGEAGRNYLEAIKSASPDGQFIVLQRAAQFLVADDPAQAEAYCRQILERRPKSVEARRTLVRALAEQGGEQRLREAATLLTEVGRVGGSTAADRRLEAILLARTGRPEDRQRSIELLEGLVQIPQQALAQDRVLLASLYENEHRLMPAYEQLLAASRQDNVAAVDLVRYAEFLYRNAGDQPQFAGHVEPVLKQLEHDPENRASAVRLRLDAAKKIPQESRRQAQIGQIIDDFTKRFVAEEKDAVLRRETFSKLLYLLARENLIDEAVRLLNQKSPSSDPLETAIALADALTLLPPGSKLAQNSEDVLKGALEKNPRSASLLYSLGNFRYVSQSRDEAVALYRRVLTVDPKHKLAMNNLALALADRPDGRPEALDIVNRALKQFGTDSGLLDTKGQILVRLGRVDEGLTALTDAVTSQGRDPLLLLHLSNAYLAANKPSEARAAYRRARAFNVAQLIITPDDRAMLERLEAHARQTATAGG